MAGTLLTLATQNTAYRLSDLLTGAVAGAAATVYLGTGGLSCRELTFRAADGNGGGKIYVGDGNVSASNYESELLAATPVTIRSDRNDISLVNKFLYPDTDSLKVAVSINYQ